MKIKIRCASGVKVPQYSHPGDSGFDIKARFEVVLQPGETNSIETGLFFEIPEGYELQIRPRSGLSLTTGLRIANSPGTVDSSYRGEVKVVATNTGTAPLVIYQGMRVAQGVLCPVIKAEFEQADLLEPTSRGAAGFGSTGA